MGVAHDDREYEPPRDGEVQCRPGKDSRTVSRTPLTLDLTVVCTSGVVVPPPGVNSETVVPPAAVASEGIDVSMSVPVVATPVPVVEQPSPPVGERVSVVEFTQLLLSENPELLQVVAPATALPSSPLSGRSSSSSSPTLPWGAADDSSPPFSPNHVQAGRSQDVPDEGSLFNVSPLSPGLVFRPSPGGQSPPAEGVLLPTTLDDFDDSVLGDPITYARCEQFPGSESPLSLPIYAWPSGSAFLLDPTLLQTVLATGTSSQPEEGSSAVAPPMDLGDGRLLETGLPGCPYRFSGSGGLPFSDGNPVYGLQLHHPRFLEFVTGVGPASASFVMPLMYEL